jgi:transcriptional regulator GlxA family with amidase domain
VAGIAAFFTLLLLVIRYAWPLAAAAALCSLLGLPQQAGIILGLIATGAWYLWRSGLLARLRARKGGALSGVSAAVLRPGAGPAGDGG